MIIGKFITLRIIEKGDIETVRKWRNSPNNYLYFANRDFITDIQQDNWYAHIASSKDSLRLMIIDNNTNQSIGITHFEAIDHRNRNANWGIYIGDLKYRKRFYAAEAVLKLFTYAFDYLNLYKIYGTTLENNSKGRAFHKFIGFHEEAVFKKHVFYDGQFNDLIWIAMHVDEWKNKHFRNLLKYIETAETDY